MIRKILFVLAMLLITTSQSFAIDGIRKGFVIGFGMGYGSAGNPVLKSNDVELSLNGFAGNMFAGYCWDNKNMLLWENIGVLKFSSDRNKGDVAKGFNGITWYHYYKPQARTFFTVVGAGEYVTDVDFYREDYRATGIGVVLGGGYEFTKQVQLGVYLLSGESKLDIFKNNKNSMIVTTISVVIY